MLFLLDFAFYWQKNKNNYFKLFISCKNYIIREKMWTKDSIVLGFHFLEKLRGKVILELISILFEFLLHL